MTDYVYDKSGQRLFFVREESEYGHPYDPEDALTKFTILAVDYPHWRRFDLIPESQDVVVPLIEKLKQYDISDSKHASAIFSGNIEPVEFTIDMSAQGLEFLPTSFGPPAYSSHGQKISQTITTIDETDGVTDGDYFLIDVIDTNLVKHYAVWFDEQGAGQAKPTITGINATNVLAIDVSGGDKTATEIADLIETALEALDGITSADNVAAVITIVPANEGAVIQAHNGAASPGFSYAVTTWGSTTYSIVEALDTNLPSFTIHLEQRNTTTGEDIIWDLFGCVVDSIEVNVNFGGKIVKYSVTFKCPYALENTNGRCTNPPPRKLINAFQTMEALKETNDNLLLQEGSTATKNDHTTGDRTPQTVDSVVLNIANNVTFKGDLSALYGVLAVASKRDITLKIVGATNEKKLLVYYQEKYKQDSGDWIPNSASGRLNTKFKLQRDATYDYINLSFYNWLLKEHNFVFVDVDEAIKSVDITLEDGSSDSNGRIIDGATFVSYIDRTIIVQKTTV